MSPIQNSICWKTIFTHVSFSTPVGSLMAGHRTDAHPVLLEPTSGQLFPFECESSLTNYIWRDEHKYSRPVCAYISKLPFSVILHSSALCLFKFKLSIKICVLIKAYCSSGLTCKILFLCLSFHIQSSASVSLWWSVIIVLLSQAGLRLYTSLCNP